jgi:hypothetical protein
VWQGSAGCQLRVDVIGGIGGGAAVCLLLPAALLATRHVRKRREELKLLHLERTRRLQLNGTGQDAGSGVDAETLQDADQQDVGDGDSDGRARQPIFRSAEDKKRALEQRMEVLLPQMDFFVSQNGVPPTSSDGRQRDFSVYAGTRGGHRFDHWRHRKSRTSPPHSSHPALVLALH